jgi:hypothetical protein
VHELDDDVAGIGHTAAVTVDEQAAAGAETCRQPLRGGDE